MVANRENTDSTVVNCLMLLSRVGAGERALGENRVFGCKTCLKEFSSFQALGGHRASHTINSDDTSLSGSPKKKQRKKTASHHTCPICGVEFPMGQALGGHMRKHRKLKEKATNALLTLSFFPETATLTTLKQSNNGKRVACLDLDLVSVGSLVNTELELGRTMYLQLPC